MRDDIPVNIMSPEITSDDIRLPSIREVGTAYDRYAAVLRTAAQEARKSLQLAGRSSENRIREGIGHTATARSIGLEGLPPGIEIKSPWIDQSATEDFQTTGFRIV